ncbi:MAG: DUF1993 domain-containing protein [Caulobacteraceae bacterium]
MPVSAFSFVGMYDHALAAAANVLDKGWAFARAQGISEAEMLGWRLIEDMQPLSFQLAVVCDFSRQWPARVAALPVPDNVAADLDVAGFSHAIAEARAWLARLEPGRFEGRDEVELTHTLGTGMTLTRTCGRWLTLFATTNLYFHLSTAYDILRARGVPIGKADLFAGGL